MARKELRANSGKIDGFNKYQKVQSLITDFKKANEHEYNRMDNLHFNGVEIDVVVNLSDRDGNIGQYGDTKYSYEPKGIIKVSEFQSGDSYQLPTKIVDDRISVVLYYYWQTLSTLENEFGDAIFTVENPKVAYQDTKNKIPYKRKSTTKFSDAYESYIIKGGKKPKPEDF